MWINVQVVKHTLGISQNWYKFTVSECRQNCYSSLTPYVVANCLCYKKRLKGPNIYLRAVQYHLSGNLLISMLMYVDNSKRMNNWHPCFTFNTLMNIRHKSNWLWHVKRMHDNRMLKIMLRYGPNGQRWVGRPLKRLLDSKTGLLRPDTWWMMMNINPKTCTYE